MPQRNFGTDAQGNRIIGFDASNRPIIGLDENDRPIYAAGAESQPAPRWPGFGVLKPAIDTVIGVGKGALDTALNVAELGAAFSPIGDISYESDKARAALAPTSEAQKFGRTVEKAAEFAIPWGTPGKAATAAGWIGKAARGAMRVGEAGAQAAAQTAMQRPVENPEDLVTAALLGGSSVPIGGLLKGMGNVAFTKLPERLYSQIFKESFDDLAKAYKTEAKGKPIDPVLAREVLERGIMGSSRNMALYSYKKLNAYEGQLQAALRGKSMTLPQKDDYVSLLDDLAGEFGDRFGETGRLAARLRDSLKASPGGAVDAVDALKIKRLLDQSRSTSSFRTSPKLSPKQEEYKAAADEVRARLHSTFPDASKALNEERVYIEAFDAVVKDAVQRNNKKLIGLTDYLLGGGGMAAGWGVAGISAAGAVRGFQNPVTLTGLGQALYRAGKAMPSADALRGAAVGSAVQTFPEPTAQTEGEIPAGYFTPFPVRQALGTAAAGDYQLSDGSWWRKNPDGSIVPVGG